MPERVDCPSCGHQVRLPEGLAGLMLRCPKCGLMFLASTNRSQERVAPVHEDDLEDPRPTPRRPRFAPWPEDEDPGPPSWRPREPATGLGRCLRCGEHLRPGVTRCPVCERPRPPEEEDDDASSVPVRRDCEFHRGRLIMTLGTISVVSGALALLGGVGCIPGLALGIPAWMMGNRDLDKMQAGLMDPQGIASTKNGRDCGIFGTVLSLVFGSLWLLCFASQIVLSHWW